jgi:trehalose 6-phosphate phosphatase
VILDFDGSLSEIVERPELARVVHGASEVLGKLVRRYRVVAILTGRPSEEITRVLDVPGLSIFGLYGLEGSAPELAAVVLPEVETATASVPGTRLEHKGISIAVHYRQAAEPPAARAALISALQPIATENGLELVEGKMVVELVPLDRPLKGGAIERVVGQRGLEAALYAGDDVADLDAFDALGRLEDRGLVAVRVAVRGPETPAALLAAADLVVEGPNGLVGLLRTLS